MLVDSHCHLHDREFFSEEQAEKFLEKARENKVEKIICVGTGQKDSEAAKKFAAKRDGIFWTFGIHPENVGEKAKFLRDEKLVAIGEVGLDYHYDGYDREKQIKLFEEMLQLARDNDLPVVFHVREAFVDFFPIMDNFTGITGVVHSFTDNKKNLEKVLARGFYVGVNGLATYSTLPLPPLERILLETDAPFLTPVPNRGKINQPAYIKDIACWLSTKMGVSVEEIAEKTTENGRKLFNF